MKVSSLACFTCFVLACVLVRAETFSTWQAAHFSAGQLSDSTISGENADPDADGIKNLLEYAYAADPWSYESGIDTVVGSLSAADGSHLTLTYRKLKNASDLFMLLQASADLRSWSFPENITATTDSSHASYNRIALRDPVVTTSTDRRFLRLVVAVDSDQDGLPDNWEMEYFGNLDSSGTDDYDLDLLNNLAEYLQSSDPTNFYNGETPVLVLTSGDSQVGFAGEALPLPLSVTVYHQGGTSVWPNAPVLFATIDDDPLEARADDAGLASTLYYSPSAIGPFSIEASAGKAPNTSSVTFQETVSALPRDLGPITAEGNGSRILITWMPAPGVTSFTVQRLDQSSGSWQAVGTAGGGENTFGDANNLEPGVIHLYKVKGSDGMSLSSFSGAEGAVVNPADNNDTDTLTNGEEVEAGSYLELRANDELDVGNMILGGNPKGWLGPDPKVTDTDRDGVADDQDGWANDPDYSPARIPYTHYAIIDLEQWGLDEEDSILFFNDKMQLAGNTRNDQGFRVPYRWESGQKTSVTLPSFVYTSRKVGISDMNNLGQIVGVVHRDPHTASESPEEGALWNQPAQQPSFLPKAYPPVAAGISLYPNEDSTFISPISITDSGKIIGTSTGALSRDRVERSGAHVVDRGVFYATTIWNGSNVDYSGGFLINPYGDEPQQFGQPSTRRFIPQFSNHTNWTFGFYADEAQALSPLRLAVWDHNTNAKTVLPADSPVSGIIGMDDANPPHLIGYKGLSTSIIWARSSAGNWVAKSPFDGGMSQINRRGEITGGFYNSGEYTTLLQNHKPVNLDKLVPAGWSGLGGVINSQGIIAGNATYKDPSNPSSPATVKKMMAIPGIEFKARDGMVEKGFDPPMSGDRTTTERDEDKWQYWASVGRSGDLATNNAVKIVFPNVDLAKACRLEITQGADSVDISPKTFTASETYVTITGKNPIPTNVISEATIEVMQGLQKIGVTLKVKVMPVRTIRLGIYYVSDSTSPVNNVLPSNTPTADSIVTRLNSVYRQACITFVKDASSGAKDVPFDLPHGSQPKDGKVEEAILGDDEGKLIFLSSQFNGQMNLAIAKAVNKAALGDAVKPIGVYPGIFPDGGKTVIAFMEYFESNPTKLDTFYHVCAHEIGHALGLSTRIDRMHRTAPTAHDVGKFPPGQKLGLMWWQNTESNWMRHEDWEKSNLEADRYQ